LHNTLLINIIWAGWVKAQIWPTLFYFSFLGLGLAQLIWAGRDPAGPVRLLVQTSNGPRKQARVNQLTRALYSPKVINYFRTVLKSSNLKQSKRRKPYLAKTKAKTKVMVLAPAGECSPLPPPFSPSSLCSSVFRLCYGFSPPFLGFFFFSIFFSVFLSLLSRLCSFSLFFFCCFSSPFPSPLLASSFPFL